MRFPNLDERGGTTAFFAFTLLGLLSFFAIAVDVGLMLNTRSEAQRVADSAALAGAGIFMRPEPPHQLVNTARAEARRFAEMNYVGSTRVDAGADGTVDIQVDPDRMRVDVTIRGGRGYLFAGLLGLDRFLVRAHAAARILNASGSACVKPLALPDLWEEGGLNGTCGDDLNCDGRWNTGKRNAPETEQWKFDPGIDRYEKWSGSNQSTATGYGGDLRNGLFSDDGGNPITGDHGFRVTLKAAPPGQASDLPNTQQVVASQFFAWRMPTDPTQESCAGGGGGGGGGAAFRQNLCSCNNNVIDFETEYPLEPGGMVGPTQQGMNALIPNSDRVTFEEALSGVPTTRVIKVALYDPHWATQSGRQTIRFNNIALFYVEGVDAGQSGGITGRFMKYADGTGSGGSGSMVRILQLVE